MKKLIFIFAMLIALNLNLLASETITLADTLWMRKTAGSIYSVAFHPNSQIIATGNGIIYLWNVENGTVSNTFTTGYYINFSESGNYLYSESTIINCNTWKVVGNITDCGYSTMSTDDSLIAAISIDESLGWRRILIYDVKTMKLQKDISLDSLFPVDIKGNSTRLRCLKFTKDEKYLLFSATDSVIRKMDLTTYQISTLGGGAMAISNDGKLLAFILKNIDKTVVVINLSTNELIGEIGGYNYIPNLINAVFSPDNKYIAFTYPGMVQVWNIETNTEEYEFNPSGGWISISNSNKYIVVGNYYLTLYQTPWYKTNVEETQQETTILYPNPTSNIITLQTTITNNNNIIANIYDTQSNLVLNKTINILNTGLQNIDIDVSSLSNGLYYLQLINNNITATYKVIINK